MRKVILFSACMFFLFRGLAQVSLQTGSANFSIPIQSWQDSRSRLSAAITLDYSSGMGLKVDEIASNVGQGWNLTMGGVIIRMQVGQPDDQKPKDGPYTDITKYPPGYLYNPAAISSGCPNALKTYPLFGSQNVLYKNDNVTEADREQDYFAFQFNGRSGMLLLGKMTSSTGGNAVFIGDTKLKGWYDVDEAGAAAQNLRTTISAIHIQDENGLIYTFQDKGITKVMKLHSCTNVYDYYYNGVVPVEIAPPTHQPWNVYFETAQDEIADADNPYMVGSWYLSNVKDPLTGRVITYSYHSEAMDNFCGTSLRGFITINGGYVQVGSSIQGVVSNGPYVLVTMNRSKSTTPVLDQVTYPDGTTVNMVYGAARTDLQGDNMLTNIKIAFQGRPAGQFDFSQSYMIRNQVRQPANQEEWVDGRLCLLSVTKHGADGLGQQSLYSFTYNLGTDNTENCVPPNYSEVRDIFGYYNGNTRTGHDHNNGNPIVPSAFTPGDGRSFDEYAILSYIVENVYYQYPHPDPSIKAGYASLGLLQTVTYPNGGTLTYSYAQNTGLFPGATTASNYGGVHVSQTVSHDGSSSTASDVVNNYSYTMPDNSSSIWGLEMPTNFQASEVNYEPEGQYLTLTGCAYTYQYAGIESIDEATSISDIQKLLAVVSKVAAYAGYAMDIAHILTSLSNPYVAIIELLVDIINNILSTCGQGNVTYSNWVYYNRDLNGSNPLPVQFSRVVVTPGSSGTPVGQTVYEFTSPGQNGVPNILVSDNTATFSLQQRALSWLYGLPSRVTVLDANGNTVKQTETNYDFSNAQRTIDDGTGSPSQGSCTCYPINESGFESDDWTNTSYINSYQTQSSGDMTIVPYTLSTGRAQVSDVYDRTFNSAGNKLETHTHYDYNPNNFLVRKTTSTLSNGGNAIKEAYYPSDYTAGGIFQTMTTNNLVDLPVATFQSIVKNQPCNDCPPNLPIYLGATVYSYGLQGNGDIKPSSVYSSWTRIANQTGGSGNFAFDPTNPQNYPNLIQTQGFEYDATTGNLVKKIDQGGRTITTLYDYNDKFLVAQVNNADPDVDKVAYTSFETTSTGAWAVSGSGTYTSTSAITGAAGCNLSGRSVTTAITIGKPYILSFWASTGSAVSVSGATLTKTGPTNNNFTYYEYAVAAGGSPGLSGSGVIDELRLYPAVARMTSYTYDAVLGKTSECDENNRIRYYEYDPFGRLHIIRDEQSNIIKMFEYNFKQ